MKTEREKFEEWLGNRSRCVEYGDYLFVICQDYAAEKDAEIEKLREKMKTPYNQELQQIILNQEHEIEKLRAEIAAITKERDEAKDAFELVKSLHIKATGTCVDLRNELDEALARIGTLKLGANAAIAQKQKDYEELEKLFNESVAETRRTNARMMELEARIKASQEQEPVGTVEETGSVLNNHHYVQVLTKRKIEIFTKLYVAPVIPPTEAELRAEIEQLETDKSAMLELDKKRYLEILSLERKQAEQQAELDRMVNRSAFKAGYSYREVERKKEFVDLLAEERKKTVPEGWKLVPIEPTEEMCNEALDCQDYDPKDPAICEMYALYKAMLSAAPKEKTE